MTALVTKLSVLLGHMERNDWDAALSLAAKFHDLGDHEEAITRAHNARIRPDFYRQLKQDPDALVAAGIAALKARYLK